MNDILKQTIEKYNNSEELKILWESTFKKRLQKTNNRKKATISANAVIQSELLTLFLKEQNNE